MTKEFFERGKQIAKWADNNMTKDKALKMAIEAMNSAYSSHGKILPSYPAQDAWLYHGCDAKLFKALQACKEALEQPAQGIELEWYVKGWDDALKDKNT
jgi:hypothetical protein